MIKIYSEANFDYLNEFLEEDTCMDFIESMEKTVDFYTK